MQEIYDEGKMADAAAQLTPEQRASDEIFGRINFIPAERDLLMFSVAGTRDLVSYNSVVARYRRQDVIVARLPVYEPLANPVVLDLSIHGSKSMETCGAQRCAVLGCFGACYAIPDEAPPLVPADTPPSLASHRLVYLGSPYTKYTAGLDAAFREVARIAANMLREGVKVYSPIAHTHPLAIYGNVDPRNHDIWLPFDCAMIDACDAMCIADMDGWDASYGVKFEVERFVAAGKPVYRQSGGEIVVHVAGKQKAAALRPTSCLCVCGRSLEECRARSPYC